MNTDTKKLESIRQYIESAYLSLQEARTLINEISGTGANSEALKAARQAGAILATMDGSKIIEGVFDGQNMVGPDGKQYSVPANYASKSKLVEGDLLKLTIAPNGSFIYKQIGPVERRRLKGMLTKDLETGEFRVIAEERAYKVLTASITYFKGEPQDDVVILIPRDKPSTWATVENIIHSDPMPSTTPSADADQPPLLPNRELPAPLGIPELSPKAQSSSVPEPVAQNTPPPPLASLPTPPDASLHFDDEKDEFEEI